MLKTKVLTNGTPEERATLAKAAILDVRPVVASIIASAVPRKGSPVAAFPHLMPAFEHFWCEFSTGLDNGWNRSHERAVIGSCHAQDQFFLMRLICFANWKRWRLGHVDLQIRAQGGIVRADYVIEPGFDPSLRATEPGTGRVLYGAAVVERALHETAMMVLEAIDLASAKRRQRLAQRSRGAVSRRLGSSVRPPSRNSGPHVIVVSPQLITTVSTQPGGLTGRARAGMRPYFRVGHWRQYKTGRKQRVWVRPHTCGSAQARVSFRIEP